MEFLKEAYTKDDEVERIPLDKCGWRSLGEIAAGTGLPTRRLYGKKPGDSGVELKQLVKDRLIEVRYFKGERGWSRPFSQESQGDADMQPCDIVVFGAIMAIGNLVL